MRVDVTCLYYMLCYAWDALHAIGDVDVVAKGADAPQELLARMLAGEVQKLLRRGIARGYRDLESDSRTLRGKILGAQTARLAARGPQRLATLQDEFSKDVLQNQVLRATIGRLVRTAGVESSTRTELAGLSAQLPEVQEAILHGTVFRRIQLQSCHREYRMALNVCELLHRHLVPEPGSGTWRFRDFEGDDSEMGLLFEQFVRSYLRREQSHFDVDRKHIRWNATGDDDALAYLPDMRTDVFLVGDNTDIVIETKCTAEVTTTQRGGSPKLRSGHLYQLAAYLRNLAHSERRRAGVLLYGTDACELELSLKLDSDPVIVRAVSLNGPWERLRGAMQRLASDLASLDASNLAASPRASDCPTESASLQMSLGGT